jgi:hypothetical protein
MPRLCTVCSHPERAAIDQALVGGRSTYELAALYRVSPDALSRHNAAHVPAALVKAREAEDVGQAIDIVKQLRAVNGASLQILHEARQEADAQTALKAIDRILRQIELQGRLLGQLAENQTQNVHLTRIEQLLNVAVPAERIPEHVRDVVLAHVNGDDQ